MVLGLCATGTSAGEVVLPFQSLLPVRKRVVAEVGTVAVENLATLWEKYKNKKNKKKDFTQNEIKMWYISFLIRMSNKAKFYKVPSAEVFVIVLRGLKTPLL